MGEGRNRGLLGALRRMVGSAAEFEERLTVTEGTSPVGQCTDRERVVLHGTIRSLTSAPAGEPPRLEAEFDDGSGLVRLIWMGRRAIAGIVEGSTLRVEGRLSCQHGERKIYNPRYQLTRVPGLS